MLIQQGISVQILSLTEGFRSIRATAEDAAENSSGYSDILTLNIDTTVPVVSTIDLAAADDSGTSNSDNITNKTTGLTFSGAISEESTVTIYDSSTAKGTDATSGGNYSLDISLAEGIRTVRARAVDYAGNVSGYLDLEVTIDRTPPSPTNISVNPHITSNQPAFTWTPGSGAVRYRYSWNNSAPWNSITTTSLTPLLPATGTYTLYVQHGDDAGELVDIIRNRNNYLL